VYAGAEKISGAGSGDELIKETQCAVFEAEEKNSTSLFETKKQHLFTYIHTCHSRCIPEGVAEVFQIFLRVAHVLSKLFSYEQYCRRDRW
jgi:hypothetical protein